jgi:hypothetical protein
MKARGKGSSAIVEVLFDASSELGVDDLVSAPSAVQVGSEYWSEQ